MSRVLVRPHWFRLPRPLPVAHGMAAMGYRVIQIPVGSKHPWMSGWPTKATSDPRLIEAWDSRWTGMNWCIATGPDVIVIDRDGPKGHETLTALESALGPLPQDTWRVISGSKNGGEHIWLMPPDGATHNLRNQQPIKVDGITYKGVDVRAWHGQAILPGSLHSSGRRYAWAPGCSPAETSLKEVPAAWWEFLPKKEIAEPRNARSRSPGRTGARLPSVPHDPNSYVIGDDGGGFNSPIWKRCLQFFRMFGAEADATEFKEALRFAILNANADNHTRDQIQRYASDSYLDAEIASARGKIANAD